MKKGTMSRAIIGVLIGIGVMTSFVSFNTKAFAQQLNMQDTKQSLGVFVMNNALGQIQSLQNAIIAMQKLDAAGKTAALSVGEALTNFAVELSKQPGSDIVPDDIAMRLATSAVDKIPLPSLITLASKLKISPPGGATSWEETQLRSKIVEYLVNKAEAIKSEIEAVQSQLHQNTATVLINGLS